MKIFLKSLIVLATLLVFSVIGLAVFIGTLNADKYRPQLVDTLSQKTGRVVTLDGALGFALRPSGIQLSIQNAAIGNPAWASRPQMAKINTFKIKIGLLPLLSHRLSINELLIEDADILLETNKAGEHNWVFTPPTKTNAAQAPAAQQTSPAPLASLSIDKISLLNSQLALRGADGKISKANVKSLALDNQKTGTVVHFTGDLNGTPLALTLKTDLTDFLSQAPMSFDADLTSAPFHLTTQGHADIASGTAEITTYDLTAGKTELKGKAQATWSGARPLLRGEMTSDHINLADFMRPNATPNAEAPAAAPDAPAPNDTHMFSTAPLPLATLRSVDVDLSVSAKEFLLGTGTLQNLSAKLVLSNGNLTLAPAKATVNSAPVEAQLKLNAAQSPAQVTAGIIATGVDLSDLQKLGDMTPFMTGKADANIQLTGKGDSAHDIAASLGGVIVVSAEKGEILTGAAAKISSALATVFNPGGGNAALNCLAARFIVKNGLMKDNGILIDTAPSTLLGQGSVNLDSETLDLMLHAKTKGVDVGSLIPPLQINGSLSKPNYNLDTSNTVKNVMGALSSGGGLSTLSSSGIPTIQPAPAGQNACIYTLDHPQKTATPDVLPTDAVGRAKSLGNSLLNGLFGK